MGIDLDAFINLFMIFGVVFCGLRILYIIVHINSLFSNIVHTHLQKQDPNGLVDERMGGPDLRQGFHECERCRLAFAGSKLG